VLSDIFIGEAADTPGMCEWLEKNQRSMHTPTMARPTWQALMNVGIRRVLNGIRAPRLVLARPDDQLVPLEAAAAFAAGIRDAQFRALPAGAHNMFDIFDILGEQIVEFVCDTRTVAASERVLATVVFTDIVGSWLRPDPSRLLSSHRRSETKRGVPSQICVISYRRRFLRWLTYPVTAAHGVPRSDGSIT
jgi:hypothetical protein